MSLVDKESTIQVIGSLLQKPALLDETDNYRLYQDDFGSYFEKVVFSAINNLYYNGAGKITAFDIDKYLKDSSNASKVFNDNNGIEYINDAIEIAELDNFPYYYKKLKKFSALRELKKMGYDISPIYYNDPLDVAKTKQSLEKFEQLEVSDILDYFRNRITNIEYKFITNGNNASALAADGIEELVKSLKLHPDAGCNLQGIYTNTATRGARKGKFYLRSSAQGCGKTRSLVGEACYISYPIRFSLEENKWVFSGNQEKSLLITTEQTIEEMQTLILAYLSGVNEEIILYGMYKNDEEERVQKAIQIMNYFKENIIIEQMPNPSISKIKAITKKHYIEYGISNLFYDYIFTSEGLLGEYRDLKVREDVALMMLSTALKDLAVELNIFVMSATQLNGEWENKKGLRNQNLIRGAKSIVDKIDVGMITLPINKDEYNIMESFFRTLDKVPTQVTDIYKNRRGKYTEVRIWSCTDLGTCRREDVFVTDPYYNPIENFKPIDFIFDMNASFSELSVLLDRLNSDKNIVEKKNEENNNTINIEEIKEEDLWDLI